ncbi:pentapeptide repeat-containing protein [Terrabacter koreensis]
MPDVKPVARRLSSELVAGDLTTASPFGLIDDRVDLRGLQVDLLSATRDPLHERVTVSAGRWQALDPSGAGLSGMNWNSLTVNNCPLDDAQLDDLRCWGVEVTDCSARRASLHHSQIGARAEGYKRSVWRRVDLQGADVRRLIADVVLEDVDLSRARFGQTDLGRSDLVRVRFRGTVRGLTIGDLRGDRPSEGWALSDVDFTRTRLRDLRLLAVDLGVPQVDLRLPDDDEQWLIRDWPEFLDRVAVHAPADLRDATDVWVDHARRQLGPHQVWGFTTHRDAVDYAGEPFADFLRTNR